MKQTSPFLSIFFDVYVIQAKDKPYNRTRNKTIFSSFFLYLYPITANSSFL